MSTSTTSATPASPPSIGSCLAATLPIFEQRAGAESLAIAKQWLRDDHREEDVEAAWSALAAMGEVVDVRETAAIALLVPIGCIVQKRQPRGGVASVTVRFDRDRLRELARNDAVHALACLSTEVRRAISARRPDENDRTAFGEHRRRRAAEEFVASALSLLRVLPGVVEEAGSLVWHVEGADPDIVVARAAWMTLQGPVGLARSIELALPERLLPSAASNRPWETEPDRGEFCYLIDPDALVEICGVRAWGLATPEGAFVAQNRAEAMDLIGDRLVVPGHSSRSLSLAEENDLVRRIADFAVERVGVRPPDGFSVRQVMTVQTIDTRVEHDGLDVSLPESLVAWCGWMVGDRVEIAFDATGAALALFRTPNGSAVLVEEDGGRITLDRTLHNLSAGWAATGSEWRRRRCEIVDGAIVLRDLNSGLPV